MTRDEGRARVEGWAEYKLSANALQSSRFPHRIASGIRSMIVFALTS